MTHTSRERFRGRRAESRPAAATAAVALTTIILGTAIGAGDAAAQKFSRADVTQTRAAVAAIAAGDLASARGHTRDIKDPVALKIITWFAITRDTPAASFSTVAGFLRHNPTWPGRRAIRKKLELALTADTPASVVLRHYRTSAPAGRAAQDRAVSILRAAKRPQAALGLIRRAWAGTVFDEVDEKDFLQTYAADLRVEDHVARLRFLLRIEKRRAREAAKRLIASKGIPRHEKAAATARMMMRGRQTRWQIAEISKSLGRLPRQIRDDIDMQFDKMVWFRRTNRMASAVEILTSLPTPPARPERWWETRERAIRHALRKGENAAAYALAKSHYQTVGKYRAAAEWTAGWIALSFLKKPALAQHHFAAADGLAKDWRERVRALYWQGRTAEALGQKPAAKSFYARAAVNPASYYGQLAASRTGQDGLVFAKAAARRAEERTFRSHELVRATRLMRILGWRRAARAFAWAAVLHAAKTPEQHHRLVALISKLTSPEKRIRTEVRLVRYSQSRGAGLIAVGYPVIDLPKENTVEKALVFALIRQESEFLARARSWVGARGLMQLMPFTARKEAKDLKLPYSTRRLTSDPAYNLRLGTHHLARLMERYEGSYPLVLAAYNAGGHRVDAWLERHSDPRKDGRLDMVDWIEMIPFSETRDYVKKVLGNYAVYRTKLGEEFDAKKLLDHWREPEALREARAAICRGDDRGNSVINVAAAADAAARANRINPAAGKSTRSARSAAKKAGRHPRPAASPLMLIAPKTIVVAQSVCTAPD